jgi:uncharacterized integral membrane protein
MRLIPLLLLPVATIVLIAFAIANRNAVVVSFDPLPFERPWPLFAIVFVALGLGIVVGGTATWVGQRKWRRLARERRRANEALQRELSTGRPALPAKTT